MDKPFLDENYWRNDFAVTEGDLNRLEAVLREAGEPLWATRLLRHVVEYKLTRDSAALDPLARQSSHCLCCDREEHSEIPSESMNP